MTGRFSFGPLALVQTLAYKQSSLRAGSRGGAWGAAAAGGVCAGDAAVAPPGAAPRPPPRPAPPRPPAPPAAHGAPNASAFRTPYHFAAGCGARHRFSPSGAAANGMPLNSRTDG